MLSFLIGSASHLQVTRTDIKSLRGSNSDQIRPVTVELLVLERLKKCCEHDSACIFDRIFFHLAGNEDMHKISDQVDCGPDWTIGFGVTCS